MARKTTEAAATTKSPAKKRTVTRRVKKTEEASAQLGALTAEEQIATRAYYISLETGNDPVENWLQAERELATV